MLTRPVAHLVAFFVVLGAILATPQALSLWLDPYSVLWTTTPKPYALWGDNRRNLLIEHLRKHPGKYKGFIISNSRGMYLSAGLATRISGTRFYNLSFSADTIFGYARTVRWLLRKQDPKLILFLLSPDQFAMDDNSNLTLMTREHPDVSGERWLSYYLAFANGTPSSLIHRNLAESLRVGYRLFGSGLLCEKYVSPYGEPVADCCNTDIETGDIRGWGGPPSPHDGRAGPWGVPPDPAVRDAYFLEGLRQQQLDAELKSYFAAPLIDRTNNTFREIMTQLRQSKIAFTCVVAPMSARALRFLNPNTYASWLSLLVNSCDAVWDFSDNNSVTRDKDNYQDWSHFLPKVGELMLLRIFNGASKDLAGHPDFGRLITQANLIPWTRHWRVSFDDGRT